MSVAPRLIDLRWPLASLLALLAIAGIGQAADLSPEQVDFFEKHVRPVLVEHCYRCHSAETKEPEGNLRLDTKAGMMTGGATGASVRAGDPKESLFLKLVRHEIEGLEMPPDKKLPDEAIARLEEWVKQGAPDPRGEGPAPSRDNVLDRVKGHWSFQPPVVAPVPEVRDKVWPKGDIDHYILARLESKGLSPSGMADRRTLIRRLSYDLVGLPPTQAEVEAFVADTRPDAEEQLVDRLLKSPQFGERWARHWLDLSRFGDTKGYVFMENRDYPEAFRYRDFVIRAFNDDLPYDQFIKLQLAADQLPPGNSDPQSLAAMGFLTLGRRFINNQQEIIDDRIDVISRTTLGLTVTCARCHDHKYDPISQKDYYALYGVLHSSKEPKDAPSPLRLVDGNVHNARVFIRGNPANKGDEVPRRYLAAFTSGEPQPFKNGSGRLDLAEAIVDAKNPLTARVWVNRVWSHLFGIGLVRTPSDLGRRSDPPAHPDVLDALAVKFTEEGWSTKKLLRRIVLASVYRQKSNPRPDAVEKDPENMLLVRQNRKRLDFEALRDSFLIVAGDVDATIGGASVKITDQPTPRRRTLYAHIDRQNLPGLFRTFDFASPDTHAPQRYETTVPQQALFLLNSPFALEQAERVAAKVKGSGEATGDRVRTIYRLLLQREPSEKEIALASQFVETSPLQVAQIWQYGYGPFDEAQQRVASFTRLPHFTGGAHQGGPQVPDGVLGWAILTAKGGHPGNKPDHAVIRRWTAPQAGTLTVRGYLKHPSEHGDGVRTRVVSSRSGVAGQWEAKHNGTDTKVEKLAVEAGDTVDFIVDLQGSLESDSFEWPCELLLDCPGGPRRFHTAEEFGAMKPVETPDRWASYAQVLLLSNEFMFVD